MSKRIVTRSTKEPVRILYKLTATDLLLILVSLFFSVLLLNTTLPLVVKLIIEGIIIGITVCCLMEFGTTKGYKLFFYALIHKTRKRFFKEERDIIQETQLEFGKYIKVNGVQSAIIELSGIDFSIIEEHRQDYLIKEFSIVLREISNGKIIMMPKPLDYSRYVDNNNAVVDRMIVNNDKIKIKIVDIIKQQNEFLNFITYVNIQKREAFYLIIQENSESIIAEKLGIVMPLLKNIGLSPKLLETKEEQQLLLKRFYNCEELENIIMPSVKEKGDRLSFFYDVKDIEPHPDAGVESENKEIQSTESNDKKPKDIKSYKILNLGKYPFLLGNAWGYSVCNNINTKVVFNFAKYGGKNLLKIVSKSIKVLETELLDKKITAEQEISLSRQIESLRIILENISDETDTVFNTECFVMTEDKNLKETIKGIRSEESFIVDKGLFRQWEHYFKMFPYIPMYSDEKNPSVSQMLCETMAGMFPFISKVIEDDYGIFLGYAGQPVFFDLFYWQHNKVGARNNCNLVLLGKPGSGKSFTMKHLFLNYFLRKTKIFILDPENEYANLAQNFGGNIIDVSGTRAGKINPLQVFPSLESDDEDQIMGDVTNHRVFLESFFSILCPKLDEDCMQYLKKIIGELYIKFKIFDGMDINKISSDKFPIFDDMLKLIQDKIKDAKEDSLELNYYKRLEMYIEDFAKGGIYARMWNGSTTLKIDNTLNIFNFQTLLNQNNIKVLNGQMLLIMRYLNQEVIRNRELNRVDGENNNIIVAIDEAHRFINPKFPIALEFMQVMAKQIRKYYGALIVTTQNIDDFTGASEQMKAQASAVINCCQYSMVFALAPQDLNSLKELYKASGGITDLECNYITRAITGQALLILDRDTRVPLKIDTYEGEAENFE